MRNAKTLLEGFLSTASVYPNAIALHIRGQSVTYRELQDLSMSWAKMILALTQKSKLQRVAIYSYRTVTNYVGPLAALFAGAAFVPLNPRFPAEKNKAILRECEPDVIIVDSAVAKNFHEIASQEDMKKYILFSPPDLTLAISDELPSLPHVFPDDVAYILFTSGSTGVPKGVPIKNRNVCSFLHFNQERYRITEKDKLSQTFEQTFDLSIFDLFMAWFHGACVVAMQAIDLLSPFKYINENKITVWFSVPSVISVLKKQSFLKPNSFPTLRLSLFCGEALLEEDMSSWAEAAPNSICENLYGPTELTIACSVYQWTRESKNSARNGILSIGKVYDHLDYVIHNGELCVSGEQCFDGYLRLPEKNQEVFISINKNNNAAIYYKTGDLVEKDCAGNLLYVGRNDQQVKVNGYRVELGEIESVFSRVTGVDRVFAFLIHENQLGLYVVGDADPKDIMEKAKQTLPVYMLPRKIKISHNILLNENGKIDRKRIKALFEESTHV